MLVTLHLFGSATGSPISSSQARAGYRADQARKTIRLGHRFGTKLIPGRGKRTFHYRNPCTSAHVNCSSTKWWDPTSWPLPHGLRSDHRACMRSAICVRLGNPSYAAPGGLRRRSRPRAPVLTFVPPHAGQEQEGREEKGEEGRVIGRRGVRIRIRRGNFPPEPPSVVLSSPRARAGCMDPWQCQCPCGPERLRRPRTRSPRRKQGPQSALAQRQQPRSL